MNSIPEKSPLHKLHSIKNIFFKPLNLILRRRKTQRIYVNKAVKI